MTTTDVRLGAALTATYRKVKDLSARIAAHLEEGAELASVELVALDLLIRSTEELLHSAEELEQKAQPQAATTEAE